MESRLLFSLLVFFGINTSLMAETPKSTILLDPPLHSMEGKEFDAKEILSNGKNIAFVFWQTWCAACLRETPRLVDAFNAHSEKIQFLGVISGADEDVNEKKIEKIVKKFGLPYPQIRDRDLSLTRKFEVKETPTIVIVGENNSVLYKQNHIPKKWTTYYR